jgi:hypothetical protein
LAAAAYQIRWKQRAQDFTRERKMPFKKLILFMLGMVKESSQNALERFFPKLGEATQMSQQAFSLARQKIKWEAFEELFRASVKGSYHESIRDWRGYLLLAVDASHIALPREAALREYYGATGHELSAATARASMVYDIENDIIVDAIIDRLACDERGLAKRHIRALSLLEDEARERKKILIFDRGYPSRDFVKYLQDNEIRYVMRVARGFSARIDGMRSGSETVRLADGVDARAVVFTLRNGEREMLITNLSGEELEDAAFPELYHKRWPIETKYNQVKQKLELENFSGRLVDSIKQDFYAMMTVSNMLASGMREANEQIREEESGKDKKYEYRANGNHAVGVLKDRLIGILITDGRFRRNRLYREMVFEIKKRTVPLRPNRNIPRKEYLKKPHFHHNHKSNC